MAVVFSEAYEGGTQGVAVTTSNTGWSSFSVAAQQTFDSTHAVTGTFSVNVALAANTAYSQKTFTAANVQYQRFYLWMDAATSAATLIARLLSGTTSRAEIRMNADRTLNVRNVTTVTGVATAALPLGEWVRVEWKVDGGAGTQELRAYWGVDLHGSTPTTTVGAAAAFTNATFDTYRLGSQTAATWTVWYDDVALDSAAYPAPTGSTSATVTGATASSTTTAPAGSVSSSSELPGATAMVTAGALAGSATAGSTVAGVTALAAVAATGGTVSAGAGLVGVPALVVVSATAGSVPKAAVSGPTVIRRTDTPATVRVAARHGTVSVAAASGRVTDTTGRARVSVTSAPGRVS